VRYLSRLAGCHAPEIKKSGRTQNKEKWMRHSLCVWPLVEGDSRRILYQKNGNAPAS
jgi:hypothetical protein